MTTQFGDPEPEPLLDNSGVCDYSQLTWVIYNDEDCTDVNYNSTEPQTMAEFATGKCEYIQVLNQSQIIKCNSNGWTKLVYEGD